MAAAIMTAASCSTISRTEKQLLKVDCCDSPDIPAVGILPPQRPSSGLAFPSNMLIIYYDEDTGTGPLLKSIDKFGAEIVYDYNPINALVIRFSDEKSVDDAVKRFEKVDGVIKVSKDRAQDKQEPVRVPYYQVSN